MDRTLTSRGDDSLTIYYADDGEEICLDIKTYFEEGRFQLRVTTVNIGSDQGSQQNTCCRLSLILLTPEMLHDLERKQKGYLSNACKQSQKQAILCHDSVDLTDPNNETVLENACSEFNQWSKIPFGISSEHFRMALLNIMQLMESTPNANPVLLSYKINPKHISSTKEHIVVIFQKEASRGDVTVLLKKNNIRKKMKCIELNSLTYTFKPEGMPDGEISMEVFTNNISLGKTRFNICNKMDIFSSMVSDLMNPLEFFLQALNCADPDSLDHELVDILTNGTMKNNPLAGLETADYRDSLWNKKSKQEYPTLLHVAAKLGFKHLCNALKKYPGYQAAICMKNKEDRTPSQIALREGHTEIAATIMPDTEIAAALMPDNICTIPSEDLASKNEESDGYMKMSQVSAAIGRRNSTPPPIPRRPSESNEVVMKRSSGNQRDSTLTSSASSLEDPFFFDPKQLTQRMTLILEDNINYCGKLTTKL